MNTKRLAADTNFPLDVAAQDDGAAAAMSVLKECFPAAPLLVPPTALHELALLADQTEEPETARLARLALRAMSVKDCLWRPVPVLPDHAETVEELAAAIHRQTGVPIEEHNDALILAEAAALGCSLLITGDRHLLDVEHRQLDWLLGLEGFRAPLIVSPRGLVRRFYR
jgi:predicted nucleic acid-binding protein